MANEEKRPAASNLKHEKPPSFIREVEPPDQAEALDFLVSDLRKTVQVLIKFLSDTGSDGNVTWATSKLQNTFAQLSEIERHIGGATHEHVEQLELMRNVLFAVSKRESLRSWWDQAVRRNNRDIPSRTVELDGESYSYSPGFHLQALNKLLGVLQYTIDYIIENNKEGRPTAPENLSDEDKLDRKSLTGFMAALEAHEIAAIKAFEADLSGMTKQEMREELSTVQSRIDEDTAWAEALSAAIREDT